MTTPTDTDGNAGQPSTRRRYGVMAFLCALSFLTYFDRVCIMRAQDDIQRDLDISDEQMGLIFGAFWLAYALFEIPAGWMGDRYGARRALTRVVLAWSLLTALSGSATGFASLLVFRFLFGVGEAGAYPNMARVQERWFPARARARAGGLLWLTARFGGAFSPILFGLMLRGFDSPEFREWLPTFGLPSDLGAWRVGFWAAGLIGVAWCLAFFPWFRDDPADSPSVNEAELRLIRSGRGTASAESHAALEGVWKALIGSPTLWAIGLMYLCGSFGWSFFVSWMPKYLKAVHDVEFTKSELMSGLPLFFGGIACLAGGVLCDAFVRRTGRKRFGRAVFPVCGYVTAAAAMYAVRFAETAGQASALMCVAAAAFDFGQGANWATIIDVGGRHAGIAAGLVNTVGNMGNVVQPYVGALIFTAAGWDVLFAVYAVAFLAAAAMWSVIDPNRTFYGAPSPPPPRP